jgi:hypothetical protein
MVGLLRLTGACSSLPLDGDFIGELYTTELPTQLRATIITHDRSVSGFNPIKSVLATINTFGSEKIRPDAPNAGLTSAPTPSSNPTNGYTVQVDERNNYQVVVYDEMGAEVASYFHDDIDCPSSLFDPQIVVFRYYFINNKVYVFSGSSFGPVAAAIIDVTTGEVKCSLVVQPGLDGQEYEVYGVWGFPDPTEGVLYEGLQIAELPIDDGLCGGTYYTYLGETKATVVHRGESSIDTLSTGILDAIAQGDPSLASDNYSYFIHTNETQVEDETTMEQYLAAAGAELRRVSLTTGLFETIATFDQGDLRAIADGTYAEPIMEPEKEIWCFSGQNKVQVLSRGLVSVAELKIGDNVNVGDGEYSRIYSFGHLDKTTSTKYIVIHGDTLEDPLEISSGHLIFVRRRGKKQVVPASNVQVGDDLVLSNSNEVARVTRLGESYRTGAYAPFSESGRLVVNNVLASSYVSLQRESDVLVLRGFKTPFSMHWLAHMATAPRRVLCSIHWDWCEQESYSSSGIAEWVLPLLESAQRCLR